MTTTIEAPVFCRQCGANVSAERKVAFGDLVVDPHGDATWDGVPIALTASQFLLLSALAQAAGALVSLDVLAERIGYDGDGDAHDVVQVQACRARRRLRAIGAPPTMIKATAGRGYRLDVELLAELAREGSPTEC